MSSKMNSVIQKKRQIFSGSIAALSFKKQLSLSCWLFVLLLLVLLLFSFTLLRCASVLLYSLEGPQCLCLEDHFVRFGGNDIVKNLMTLN